LSGVTSPACSASAQQFFRGSSLISPVTYLRACRLGSTRAKQPARHQLIQHPACRQAFVYRGSGSRLEARSCHELMIMRRLSPLAPITQIG
jgi:hypothetical protein